LGGVEDEGEDVRGDDWADDEGVLGSGVWVRAGCLCGEAESGGGGGGDEDFYGREGLACWVRGVGVRGLEGRKV